MAAGKGTLHITNHTGLPDPLYRAVSWDDYSRGDSEFSVTDLIKPPRIVALERKHWEELEIDASDLIWVLIGKAAHEILHRSAADGVVEERLFVDVDGVKISGKVDYMMAEKALWDYKLTKIFAVKDGPKPEWIAQLNCYRWMAVQYGVNVESLRITAILLDWGKRRSRLISDYPKAQTQDFMIPIWPNTQTENYIRDRLRIHIAARTSLPECTSDEMWEQPGKAECWAVRKSGSNRALKLHYSREMAESHASTKPDLKVEHREAEPPERRRCDDFCAVSQYCEQYRQWREINEPKTQQELL